MRDGFIELPELLRAWRVVAGVKLGRGKPLPQTEVAERMGVSERWYRGLENGAAVSLTPEVLGRLAEALVLGQDERMVLYGQTFGGTSLAAPDSAAAAADLDALTKLIEAHPLPAYLTDHMWNIRGYNAPMAEWFPWVLAPGANLMRWALTTDEAREQFVDWPVHAEVYLAMLRFALASRPESAELGALLDELLGDPGVRKVWDRRPQVVAYRQGHHFRLSLPHVAAGELVLQSVVLTPAYHQDVRCVLLVRRDAPEVQVPPG
ncbi:helix-turn-helix transcriptional regulator [Streptomyces sp. NPDC046275]|uniref:helix-turn-helix domain-containing protein n=1 Tax=Streptomyces sp. NPDC046275 TaxID=3157201 RepID=UPI0033F167B2